MKKQVSRWFLLVIVSSAVFLSVLDIFIVNIALPSIKKGIHGTNSDIQLVIVLYLLGYASFLITGGRAGDHFGKKNVFVTAMVLFILTSAMCGLSQSSWQINTSRLLQGISAAFMIPQTITFIQVLFPVHQDRIKAFGIYGIIAGTAAVIGQFLGGLLPILHFLKAGWRLIFLINLPIGLIFVILGTVFLNDTKTEKNGKFDISGVILLSVSLISLLYPLVRGRELHWPLWSLLSIALSVILLYSFAVNQRNKLRDGKAPLVDVRLFAFKDFNIGLLTVLFFYMVQDTYFLINVILFQTGFGINPAEIGIYFAFQGVAYILASLIAVRLMPVYGKKILQAGVLIMIIAMVFHLLFIDSPAINRYALFAILFLYGVGCGSVLPSLLTIALKSIPLQFAGAASGVFTTFQKTAIALGISIIGGIFFYKIGSNPNLNTYLSAYRLAGSIIVLLLFVVSFFLYLLPDKPKPQI
ncbi:MAG: transporter [Mucilaginibacter sp.]|nr:transporter [Mucilaginibacter sp.]